MGKQMAPTGNTPVALLSTEKETDKSLAAQVSSKVFDVTSLARSYVKDLTTRAAVRAESLREQAMRLAVDRHVQVTTASAVGGAVTFGTAGGATGLVAGGAVGAVVGVPAALFTFGLSIPLCSTVGAVVGGGTGATVCGTTGLVGGGAVGYLGYAHKEEIKHGTTGVINKVGEYKDFGKAKVSESAAAITNKVCSVLGRSTKLEK